jgi:hypothetical protein
MDVRYNNFCVTSLLQYEDAQLLKCYTTVPQRGAIPVCDIPYRCQKWHHCTRTAVISSNKHAVHKYGRPWVTADGRFFFFGTYWSSARLPHCLAGVDRSHCEAPAYHETQVSLPRSQEPSAGDPILSQMNQLHFNIILHPYLELTSGLFITRF